MASPIVGPPGRDDSAAPTTQDMVGPRDSTEPTTNREEQSQAFVGQVKQIHTQLDDIARQYPAFAAFARRAQDSLKEGMIRTLSEMQSQPAESTSLAGVA